MNLLRLSIVLILLISTTNTQGLFDSILNPFKNILGGSSQNDSSSGIRNSPNIPLLARIARKPDGSGNNVNNPNWGKVKTQFIRLTYPAYADGAQKMLERGAPRQISNIVGAIQPNQQVINNRLGLNMLFLIFGQFIDHDIGFIIPSFTEKAMIKVPRGDPSFDPSGQGNKQIQFSRSKFVIRNGVRAFQNQMTHWLDGSVLYGSDPAVTSALRQKSGGKMKMNNTMLTRDKNGAFLAGQLRTSQNVGLTSMVTIFYREHNRQCQLLRKKLPNLNDEELFQIARNKVVGFIQKIAFKEYLPLLLGKQAYDKFIGPYQGYNSQLNPSLSLQFTTAAYRIGHPLLADYIQLLNLQNQRIKVLPLSQMFVSFQTLKLPQQVDFILNGLMRRPCKQRNNQIVSSVRNMFVQFPGIVQDLFSLNLQRGRDHGMPDYNSVRRKLGIKPIRDFDQISKNQDTVERLKQAYNDDVNNIDLWVGIISQQPLKNGNLGYIGAKIVGETFRKLRDADRFWYQSAFPRQDIAQIQNTNLGLIIARNSRIQNFPAEFIANPFSINEERQEEEQQQEEEQ